jgi:hypothetical protein
MLLHASKASAHENGLSPSQSAPTMRAEWRDALGWAAIVCAKITMMMETMAVVDFMLE